MGKISRVVTLAAMGFALVTPTVASADTIAFDQVQEGGSVVASGGGAIGTNIIFEYITYDGKAAFCGDDFSIQTGTTTNCYLNFDTNADTLTLSAPNGLFDINGVAIPNTTGDLVTGLTFLSSGFADLNTKFTALGLDVKSLGLLDYFGIEPGVFIFNETTIRVTSTGQVTEADFTNFFEPGNQQGFPEPATLSLFGLGLLAVGRRVRARTRRQ